MIGPDGEPALGERTLSDARSALALPVFALLTLACSALAVVYGTLGRRAACDAMIRWWARRTLALFNVRVEAEGLADLPPGGGFLLLFNHQSHIDVPTVHAVIPGTLRFGAKIELFRIPVFGAGMRAAGVLPIARHDRAEVFRVYRAASARFADGWSFALAAEGTRQEEPRIGPFKKGPFLFALEAQAPIVPVVLKGTAEVLPKGRLAVNAGRWSRTVKLRVLPAVATKGLGRRDLARVMDEVRTRMLAAWEELDR